VWSSIHTGLHLSIADSLFLRLQKCGRGGLELFRRLSVDTFVYQRPSGLDLFKHHPQPHSPPHPHTHTPLKQLVSRLGRRSSLAATPASPLPTLRATTHLSAMAVSTASRLRTIAWECLIILLICNTSGTFALFQTLCSSQNTGSGLALGTNMGHSLMHVSVNIANGGHHVVSNNIYQSNGRCKTTCQAEYAFAIVQFTSCWCSNYAPADTVPVSSCGVQCPGYPPEKCGDQPTGLFGYIALDKNPSGTIGAATSSSTSSTSTSSTPVTVAVNTVISVQSVSSLSLPASKSSRPVSSTSTLSLSAASTRIQLPTSSSLGASTPLLQVTITTTVSSMAHFGSFFDSSGQAFPSRVIVQQTVTISPSVVISIQSVV